VSEGIAIGETNQTRILFVHSISAIGLEFEMDALQCKDWDFHCWIVIFWGRNMFGLQKLISLAIQICSCIKGPAQSS